MFRIVTPIIILPAIFICSVVLMTGCSPEYHRKDAEDHFFTHEKEFLELTTLFDSLVKPFDSIYFVLLDVEAVNDDLIGFAVCPQGLVDKDHPIVGGSKIKIESPIIDSVLSKLKWTRVELDTLINMLKETDCPSISTMEGTESPIEIQYRRSGLGIFYYYIYSSPPSEEIIEIQGKPISNSGIGSRTIIRYLSSL